MIAATDIKKGMAIELDGQLYTIIDFQHIKMGRGSAQIRIKLKDIRAGHTVERSFQATERFADVRLEISNAQYLYQDGDLHYFMDVKSFEQIPLSTAQLGDAFKKYFREGMTLVILRHGDRAVGVEMPLNVELKVTETGPSFKGNTAQSGTKPAKLETGITVQVPFFINNGDVVRVDTRSGSYVERVG
jgi:elongation factor P